MNLTKLANTLVTLLAILLIIASGLSSHFLISQTILLYGLVAYTTTCIAIAIINTQQRSLSLFLALYAMGLFILLHFNTLTTSTSLLYILTLFTGLFLISFLYKRLSKQLQVVSNINTLSQILMLILIPLYSSIGYQLINSIKKSYLVTSVRLAYSTKIEELSISNPDALEYYYQAKEKAYEGKINDAYELLIEATNLEKRNAYLHSELFRLQMSRQLWIDGIKHINKSIELAPDHDHYLSQRIMANLQINELDAAKDDIKLLRQKDPRNAIMHLALAQISLKEKEYDNASIQIDSAERFCSNYFLGLKIDQFIKSNSGPNKYFNMITPHETDMLATNIFYYYKKYQTTTDGEPDAENGIPQKGNFTRQQIKQHIKRNYNFFLDQEIDFVYLYQNNTNILVVIPGKNCKLSKQKLNHIFVEPNIFTNFQLKVLRN